MADYYTEWTIGFSITKEQKHWIEKWLADKKAQAEHDESDWAFCSFDWHIHPTSRKQYDFRADSENGGVELFVQFAKAFLKKWGRDKAILVDWAYTCSSNRLDGFGGGAVVITWNKAVWLDTKSWMFSKSIRMKKQVLNKEI